MRMRVYRAMIALMMLAPIGAFAGSPVGTYAEARKVWEQSKSKDEYQAYASEFVQFNNHFQIDVKSGCYTTGAGSVSLMLVITHPDGDPYAVIEHVLSDVSTTKALCFKKAYSGGKAKAPPFTPFVLKMDIR